MFVNGMNVEYLARPPVFEVKTDAASVDASVGAYTEFLVIKVSPSEKVGDLIAKVLKFGSAPFGLVTANSECTDAVPVEIDAGRIVASVAAIGETNSTGTC